MIALGVRRVLRGVVVPMIAMVSSAHVGTYDVFFAGKAGPYDVQVTVRPPTVIPGLAAITVRVRGDGVRRITAQAAQWNLGVRGAPAPDELEPVAGARGLYSTQLWLMTSASYAINVSIDGALGTGRTVIPVSAVATRRLPMARALGWTLAGLCLFLTVGALTIVQAAAAEGTLAPGETPDPRRVWRARGASLAAALVMGTMLLGGWRWWNGVDGGYARRLFRPLHATATVRADSARRVVRLAIDDQRWASRQTSPLVPDHGKLMHLFLVRSPGMDAFAHLHPTLVDSATFDAALGSAPAGQYRFYADIVHESGFAQTLVGEVVVPAGAAGTTGDVDDAVSVADAAAGDTVAIGDGASVVWHRPRVLIAGADEPLQFSVVAADGRPVSLEPYLGMPAHALVSRADGAVFAHLHAGGSFAMASQQVLEAIQRGDTLPSVRPGASPRAIVRQADTVMADHPMVAAGPIWLGDSLSFPFAFPSGGRYRVWVQVRRNGVVRTAAFDAAVADRATR